MNLDALPVEALPPMFAVGALLTMVCLLLALRDRRAARREVRLALTLETLRLIALAQRARHSGANDQEQQAQPHERADDGADDEGHDVDHDRSVARGRP